LAFGLAWLGRPAGECHRLIEEARHQFHPCDQAQSFLFRAYEYRIGQALAGETGRGPLATDLLKDKDLEQLRSPPVGADWSRDLEGKRLAYAIDRLRAYSEILEPHATIYPYRHHSHPEWERMTEVWQLCDVADPGELAERIHELMQACADRAASDRACILQTALELSPRLDEGLARDLLSRVAPLLRESLDPWQ
jgi:hypothetical protein